MRSLEMSNVHAPMQAAILESQELSAMSQVQAKVPEHVRAAAQEICGRHGVTLSAYIRHVLIALVQDYGGNADS